MSNTVQFLLAIWLFDRVMIIRKRYRIGIESVFPNKYSRGYFAIWIYSDVGKGFGRSGGKRLLFFHYGTKLKA